MLEVSVKPSLDAARASESWSPMEALSCPDCHGALKACGQTYVCTQCPSEYRRRDGFFDFAPEIGRQPGIGQAFMETSAGVRRYESRARPAFLRIMGANWGGRFSPQDEEQYLRRSIAPVTGPVLDLACGSGQWTRIVADVAGPQRVVGLDLSVAMLNTARFVLPNLRFLRGSATKLPFGNGSLGAVNLSNALQVIPEPQRVIAEIGRCLREGGTFTCFTFRRANNFLYRLLQWTFSRVVKVRPFREDELRSWIESAGMEVVDISGPRLILLLTARRKRV